MPCQGLPGGAHAAQAPLHLPVGAAAAARVSHESGCFILLTKTDHRPFQATMKTAARQKRRRASVSICKQNKTRYDERAEEAALGQGPRREYSSMVGECMPWDGAASLHPTAARGMLGCLTSLRFGASPAQPQHRGFSLRPRTNKTPLSSGMSHSYKDTGVSVLAFYAELKPGCHTGPWAWIKQQNPSEHKLISN